MRKDTWRNISVITFMLFITSLMYTLKTYQVLGSGMLETKEGIQPYNLSQNEKYLLQSFGMDGNSQIISFNAPKDATTLDIKVYKLEDNGDWDVIGGGGISTDQNTQSASQLNGVFTMQLRENYVIDFNINSQGRASYQTNEIILDTEMMASTKGFLQEYQEIDLDKEIPVALMVYDSGTVMESYSLEDYFDPTKFRGMDLVQIVTLTFTSE